MTDLIINDSFSYNNSIYFCDSIKKIPGRYDIEEKKIFIEPDFHFLKAVDTIDQFVQYKDKVLALSVDGQNAILFDITSKDYNVIDINVTSYPWGNYVCSTAYEDHFYILTKVGNIVDVTIKTGTVDIIEVCNNVVSGCSIKDCIWVFQDGTDNVYKYSLAHKSRVECKTNKKISGVVCTSIEGNEIYLSFNSGIVMRYDTINNELVEFWNNSLENLPCKVVFAGDKCIMLPLQGKNIYILNRDGASPSIYNLYPKEFKYNKYENLSKYVNSSCVGEVLYFMPRVANRILSINKLDGGIDWIRPIGPVETDYAKYIVAYNGGIVSEGEVSLNGFLDLIKG